MRRVAEWFESGEETYNPAKERAKKDREKQAKEDQKAQEVGRKKLLASWTKYPEKEKLAALLNVIEKNHSDFPIYAEGFIALQDMGVSPFKLLILVDKRFDGTRELLERSDRVREIKDVFKIDPNTLLEIIENPRIRSAMSILNAMDPRMALEDYIKAQKLEEADAKIAKGFKVDDNLTRLAKNKNGSQNNKSKPAAAQPKQQQGYNWDEVEDFLSEPAAVPKQRDRHNNPNAQHGAKADSHRHKAPSASKPRAEADFNNSNNDVGGEATINWGQQILEKNKKCYCLDDEEMNVFNRQSGILRYLTDSYKVNGYIAPSEMLQEAVINALMPIQDDIEGLLSSHSRAHSLKYGTIIFKGLSNKVLPVVKLFPAQGEVSVLGIDISKLPKGTTPEEFLKNSFSTFINELRELQGFGATQNNAKPAHPRQNFASTVRTPLQPTPTPRVLSPEEKAVKLQKEQREKLLFDVKAKLGLVLAGEKVSIAVDHFLEKAIVSVQKDYDKGRDLKDPKYAETAVEDVAREVRSKSETGNHFATIAKHQAAGMEHTPENLKVLQEAGVYFFQILHLAAIGYVQEQSEAKNAPHATRVRSKSQEKFMSSRGQGHPG